MDESTVDYWNQGWAPIYDDLDTARTQDVHVDFYAGLVGPDTRSLLDLGCGTGSITAPVVARMRAQDDSLPAVGVDLSPDMVAFAASRYPAIEWKVGDIRRPPVTGPFDLVMCCFHTMQALHQDADMIEALSNIRDLLSDTGRFAFDIYQPNLAYLDNAARGGLEPGRIVREFTDSRGRALRIREDSTYDPQALVFSGTWYLHDADTDARLPVEPMVQSMRQFFPDVLQRMMDQAGLKMLERYGDLDRSAFTPESKRQVIVCGRA